MEFLPRVGTTLSFRHSHPPRDQYYLSKYVFLIDCSGAVTDIRTHGYTPRTQGQRKLAYIPIIPEVAIDWSGKLETFFAQRNYRFISALYGSVFSGYMGVAIAYPMALYEVKLQLQL